MAFDRCECSRNKYDRSATSNDCCTESCVFDGLPDSLLQQHLLPRLSSADKKIFRCAHKACACCSASRNCMHGACVWQPGMHAASLGYPNTATVAYCSWPKPASSHITLWFCCRLTSPRQRQLVNQTVRTVVVPAQALNVCPPGTKLGQPFPAARTLQVGNSTSRTTSSSCGALLCNTDMRWGVSAQTAGGMHSGC